jgi:uncharacterized protein (TIRG00374 family)
MEPSQKRLFRHGLRVFLGISIIASLVILILTVRAETFDALSHLKPQGFVILIVAWFLFIILDGLRFQILTRAGDTPLTIRKATEVLLMGNFLAAVTPFQTGGLPIQLIVMNRHGINPGKATAFLAFRGMMIYLPVYSIAPFFAVSLLGLTGSGLLAMMMRYLFVLLAIILVAIIFAVASPKRMEKILLFIERKSKGRIHNLVAFIVKELAEFRSGMGLFMKNHNIKYLIASILLSAVALFIYVLMPSLVLYGLGLDPAFPRAMFIQILLMGLLLFIPTPGAAAVAEAGGAAVFALVCPTHLLGIFVILWRLFTFYLGAFVGGVISLKEV